MTKLSLVFFSKQKKKFSIFTPYTTVYIIVEITCPFANSLSSFFSKVYLNLEKMEKKNILKNCI